MTHAFHSLVARASHFPTKNGRQCSQHQEQCQMNKTFRQITRGIKYQSYYKFSFLEDLPSFPKQTILQISQISHFFEKKKSCSSITRTYLLAEAWIFGDHIHSNLHSTPSRYTSHGWVYCEHTKLKANVRCSGGQLGSK